MSTRPWRDNRRLKEKVVSQTLTAMESLGNEALAILNTPAAAPAPTKRIENKVCRDVTSDELSKWRNDGWHVVHYQFIDNGSHGLAVVMERTVEVQTIPVYQVEQTVEPPAPAVPEVTPADEKIPPFSIEIPDVEREPSLLEKLAKDKPILAALMEHGPDAVKAAMDEKVINTAREAYDDALTALDKPIERFQSKLLTTGHVEPDTITLANDVIEVVLS